jgi:hypothetical protein
MCDSYILVRTSQVFSSSVPLIVWYMPLSYVKNTFKETVSTESFMFWNSDHF